MSLLIKAKFWNKSNNIIIDYSDKAFTIQKKELFKSGTLYRKGNKLSFKQTGILNTTNNSNEKTDYMNNYHEIKLISVEKKGDTNYIVDCGEWSKDIIELIDQSATYFLYKGSTIENFMKDKHRYHILSQGDIIKIGKIYLKVLHIKLNKPESKNVKTSSNKDESDNNNKSNSNSNNNENDEIDKEDNQNNRSNIKNDLIIEGEQNQDIKKKFQKKSSNLALRFVTESLSVNNGKAINNKNINRSMVLTQKLNLTQRTIDINSINEERNLSHIKQSKKWKKSRNKNDPKKKPINDKEIDKDKLINEKLNKKVKNKICRICFNGETNANKNPLICPCICKGSMKYIHYLCLKNWLNLKVESELGRKVNIEKEKPTITYNKNEIRCELCKSKFPDYVRHNDKLYNVSFYKPKYDQFIVLESVRNDNRRTKFIHIIPLNSYSMHRVGRLNNCDLSLPDTSVSRVHCCFYIENGQLVLENNSKYGTKVLIQNPKLNIIPDYPLCIEAQNTYLKIYVKKGFQFFACCGDSTKSYVRMHPYQNQNQKGFDLFCSMVFKSDDENDSEDDKEENEEECNNINLIDNNNEKDNNEKIEADDENKKMKKENKKEEMNKEKKNKEKSGEIKSSIEDSKNKDQCLETKKQEKNLININIKDENNLIEDTNLKNIKKDISIINKNLNVNLIENENMSKDQLIDEDIKDKDKKNSVSNIKDNEDDIIKKNEIKKDLISIEKQSCEKSIQTESNPKKIIDKKSFNYNNKETENPQEDLIRLEGEEHPGRKKKNIINLFNHHETKSIKSIIDKVNKNSIENESNLSNENIINKSNKYINLDQINNLSYKVEKDRINKNNISVINNYESIFGLLPNDKNESSLLLAPKHNKNIKFGNYDIHSEADKISNQKSGNKMWNKFNWNFK